MFGWWYDRFILQHVTQFGMETKMWLNVWSFIALRWRELTYLLQKVRSSVRGESDDICKWLNDSWFILWRFINCVDQTASNGRMIINEKLETMWKEAVVTYCKALLHYSTMWADGDRKKCQDSRTGTFWMWNGSLSLDSAFHYFLMGDWSCLNVV
jgi:hypothetical protein